MERFLTRFYCAVLLISSYPTKGCQDNLIPLYDEGNRHFVKCNLWDPVCPTLSRCQRASPEARAKMNLKPGIVEFLCCVDPKDLQNQAYQQNGGQNTPPPYTPRPANRVLIRQPEVPRPPNFPWGNIPQHYLTPAPPPPRGIPTPPGFPWGIKAPPSRRPPIDKAVAAGAIASYPGTQTRDRVVSEVLPNSMLWEQLPPEWKHQNVRVVIVSASGLPKLQIPTTTTQQPAIHVLVLPEGSPDSLFPDRNGVPPSWLTDGYLAQPDSTAAPSTAAPTPPPETQPPATETPESRTQPPATEAPPSVVVATTTSLPSVLPPREPSRFVWTGIQPLGAQPRVTPLIVGEVSSPLSSGAYVWSGSVTLVQDTGYNILVDSGSAAKRYDLIKVLALQGLRPENVDVLILTHGHPDHIGNDNLFPGAQKFFADSLYKGDQYIEPLGLENPVYQLTNNVEIWKTPGHTMQHNSVVVRNASALGDVAIAGDLFINAVDITESELWQNRSVNVDLQSRARNLIICQVDFIVPGHGPMFRLTADYKRTVCNAFISYRRIRRRLYLRRSVKR